MHPFKSVVFFLIILIAARSPATPSASQAEIDRGVQSAFLYAFPVYQMARTRAEAIENAARDGRIVVNRFGHRTRLSGPQDRLVTTPNNDTLYSAAWLDLAEGPVVLSVPALPDRYHSVALMDIFTDHFAVEGTRTLGGKGGSLFILGPDDPHEIPDGMTAIRAPTNDVWTIVRVLVDGPDDLAAAIDAQRGFTVKSVGTRAPPATRERASRAPDARQLLRVVNDMLARNPLPSGREKARASAKHYGIGAQAPDWGALSPAIRASWERQLPRMIRDLRDGFASVGTVYDGWSYPRPGMGNFGDDEFYRAAVALGGLAALPAEEADYLTATVDSENRPLDGAGGTRRYSLRIPPDVPVDAFWSLSIYEIDADGRLFFSANPIDRYAIGSRTAGLLRDPDGSITLQIGHTAPAGSHANWLPAPSGPFRLTFRGYLPTRPFSESAFRLPPVTSAVTP